MIPWGKPSPDASVSPSNRVLTLELVPGRADRRRRNSATSFVVGRDRGQAIPGAPGREEGRLGRGFGPAVAEDEAVYVRGLQRRSRQGCKPLRIHPRPRRRSPSASVRRERMGAARRQCGHKDNFGDDQVFGHRPKRGSVIVESFAGPRVRTLGKRMPGRRPPRGVLSWSVRRRESLGSGRRE